MRRVVADAGAIAAWFPDGQGALRGDYEAGTLTIVGPRSLPHDLVAELAARAGTDADLLARLATEVDRLGFDLRDLPSSALAGWIARGLDTRRASYAALAEELDLTLVTDDEALRRAAGPRARPSAGA